MKKTDLITIDPKQISILQEKGGKLLFKRNAEDALISLLTLRDMVDKAIENAKLKIAEAGTELDPGFKGIKGDKVEISYRRYGEKYEYDWKKKDKAEPFLIEKIYYKVDSAMVDGYVEKTGELPEGISEKEREKTIKLLEDKDESI
jgi:hypothetical protein